MSRRLVVSRKSGASISSSSRQNPSRKEIPDYSIKVSVLLSIVLCSIAALNLQARFTSRNIAVLDNETYIPQRTTSTNWNQQDVIRSSVAYNEFFHKSPDTSVLDTYFFFQPPDWELDAPRLRLRPIWQCSDPTVGMNTKLIVFHMFRSAGSTMRAFFRAYSNVCERSMAVVSHCIDLGVEFMQNDIWRNGKGSPRAAMDCWLNSATNRTGGDIPSAPDGFKNRITTAFLKEHEFDILAGHLPLGSDAYWLEKNQQRQHVILLRHPLHKFVSQALFAHEVNNITVEQAVALVDCTATKRLASGNYYQAISNFLIRPDQKSWVEQQAVDWSPEQRANLTLSNLFHHPILVGLVESWEHTIQMLSFILDKASEVSSLVNYFLEPDNLKTSALFAAMMEKNNRTKAVVAEIERDPRIFQHLQELLGYEMLVYDYAKKLHERQYQWMLEDLKEREASEHNEGYKK